MARPAPRDREDQGLGEGGCRTNQEIHTQGATLRARRPVVLPAVDRRHVCERADLLRSPVCPRGIGFLAGIHRVVRQSRDGLLHIDAGEPAGGFQQWRHRERTDGLRLRDGDWQPDS